MSKLQDYRKWDHLEDDSDEDCSYTGGDMIDGAVGAPSSSNVPSELRPSIASDQPPQLMTKKSKEGRFKFEYEGRTIYEWEQSLEEVNIYIQPPSGVPRHMFDIKISHRHLQVGLKGSPPFIDEDTGGPVKPDESIWTLSDGELNINLQKMNKAEAWECALVGRAGQTLDAFTKEEVRKKLMLERFQEEVRNRPRIIPVEKRLTPLYSLHSLPIIFPLRIPITASWF